jgi:pimeloyl-ACP methyl ester carboxylesterase
MKKINILLLIFTSFLLLSCGHLFYQPGVGRMYQPDQFKVKFEEVHVQSFDGIILHGWYVRRENPEVTKPKGLILMLHGNAENISTHFLNLLWITKKGYDYIIFDYRGYGESTGEPSQKGLYQDSLTMLDYSLNLAHSEKYPKFIAYGQSLGGNVMLRGLQGFDRTSRIDLVVLDSTFLSNKWMGFDKLTDFWFLWPLSPLAFVALSDEYSPRHFVSKLDRPTLYIHGEKDKVVPVKFGREIFSKLSSVPVKKKWDWFIPDGEHIDVFSRHDFIYRKKFIELLESL